MVSFITNFFKNILSYLGLYNKNASLLFLGLDNAGKTTLLGKLKTNKIISTGPTGQPNNEELKMDGNTFNTYDLGGHESARKVWRTYFPAIDGIIFLVDASLPERFKESKKELEDVLSHPDLDDVPVVILGNKIDLSTAVSEQELRDSLDFNSLLAKETRPLALYMGSVVKEIGYADAFRWIGSELDKKQ